MSGQAKSRPSRLPIAALITIFVVAAVGVSLYAPAFEAPDEPTHFGYIRHLVTERALPRLGEGSAAENEAGQAPLYYLAGALVSLAAGDWTGQPSLLPTWDDHNPDVSFVAGFRSTPDLSNRNLYAHAAAEGFPFRGDVLALHLVRLVGVVFGLLAVVTTYLTAREVWPERPARAVVAALLLGLNPQFIFICGVGSNDSAAAATASLTLYLLARCVRRGLTYGGAIALGGAYGLAMLAKLNLLGLAPVVAVGVLVAVRPLGAGATARIRTAWPRVLSTVLAATVVAGWWYAMNWARYGDPLAWQQMLAAQGTMTRPEPIPFGQALAALYGARDSYWALFGWSNVLGAPGLYVAADLLVVVALGAAAVSLLRRMLAFDGPVRGRGDATRPVERLPGAFPMLVLLSLWGLIASVSLVRWIQLNTAAAQGRLLFPSASAIAILLAVGLTTVVPRRADWAFAGLFAIGLTAFGSVALLSGLVPAYQKPNWAVVRAEPAPSRGPAPVWLPARWGTDLALDRADVQYRFPSTGASASADAPGIGGSLWWRRRLAQSTGYRGVVRLVNSQEEVIGEVAAPIIFDEGADSGRQDVRLGLPSSLLPDRYRLELLVVTDTGSALEATPRGARDALPAVTLWIDDVLPPCDCLPPGSTSKAMDLQNGTRLLGYTREVAGDRVDVVVYWQARAPLSGSYVSFVHLLDRDNRLVSQYDAIPYGGSRPTNMWRVGEVVPFAARLALPRDGGPFRLRVGMYEYPSLAHVTTVAGQPHVSLGLVAPAAAPTGPALVFQGGITLLGHVLERGVVKATLTLYWQASSPPSYNYTVFVQLLDATGRVVSQGDGPTEWGERPMTDWPPSQIVIDPHGLEVPESRPLRLIVGLYRLADGVRLTTTTGADFVDLGELP